MSETLRTTSEEAQRVGDEIGVDWTLFDSNSFASAWTSSSSTAPTTPQTDVTRDDPILTGKIALAHMKELPTTTSVSIEWKKKPCATGL